MPVTKMERECVLDAAGKHVLDVGREGEHRFEGAIGQGVLDGAVADVRVRRRFAMELAYSTCRVSKGGIGVKFCSQRVDVVQKADAGICSRKGDVAADYAKGDVLRAGVLLERECPCRFEQRLAVDRASAQFLACVDVEVHVDARALLC